MLPQRFTEKFIPEPMSGCWLWTATVQTNGYGRFGVGRGTHVAAHRFAFEALRGPIPNGLEIDHLCRVRSCVNPDHMQSVTHLENMARAQCSKLYMRKKFCKKGHDLQVHGFIVPSTNGQRCRICESDRSKSAYHRRKNVRR